MAKVSIVIFKLGPDPIPRMSLYSPLVLSEDRQKGVDEFW